MSSERDRLAAALVEAGYNRLHMADKPGELADALLPTVRALQAEAAAEAVRWAFVDAGDEVLWANQRRRPVALADWLAAFGEARAAALRQQAGQ